MTTPRKSPPKREKRARLEGGAISDEVLDSSASVVRSTGKGTLTGLQQYFSPPEASKLACAVLDGKRLPVLDPTAGDGALLSAFDRPYGIEIDRDHTKHADYTAISGDVQRIYPMLRLLGVEFPAVVLNPPFGLTWTASDGTKVNSMLQTYRYANGLLAHRGQGMMIAARDRFWREVAPEAPGVYCVIDCEDLFEGVELSVLLAFFTKTDASKGDTPPRLRLSAPRSGLVEVAAQVCSAREERGFFPVGFADSAPLTEAFRTVAAEHKRRMASPRSRRARYDLAAQGQRLRCHLSAFARVALAERGMESTAADLNGKSIHYFALNLREWRQITSAAEDGLLTLDPALPEQVERIVAQAVRDATPLYPVKPQMRLGFLEDLETLKCTASDPELDYLAGESYPLSTRTNVLKEPGEKIVEDRHGEQSVRKTLRERRLLEVCVGARTFDETKQGIEYLLEHFEVPDPGDIATRFPKEYERAVGVIRSIEADYLTPRGFAFKPFQVDDLARLLAKGSGPLGWDTGLGKTLGQLSWALACVRYWGCQDACLFVMPQDLLGQFKDETMRFFGRTVELIRSPAAAKAADRHVRRGGSGWYATYYEALAIVGRRDEPLPTRWFLPPGEQRFKRPTFDEKGDPVPRRMLSSDLFCPECHGHGEAVWNGTVCKSCGYVHKRRKVRSIGSLLGVTFRRGIICVDELTEMQGNDSLRGKGVRGLRCRHPLGATGTLVSNFINSCFYGMWWCCGNASARFPFSLHDKRQFERMFCVLEHIYGDPALGEEDVRKRTKILPEVTNLSLIWRLFSTNMVRRRKEDCGEDIVPRFLQPIAVPAGIEQLRHHEQVMADFPRWFTATHPDSPLVLAGTVERFAAGCGMLPKLDYVATMPEADPDHAWWGVASNNWTPATLKVLELALKHVRKGQKVMIGSSLVETGPWLAARLNERSARAVHITEQRDGKATTMSPQKRAAALKEFREGSAQVLCTGVMAVKFGHNLPEVSVVIIHGPPWTHLAFKQYVDRAWRLTSPEPINVYTVYTRELIGERKKQLVNDKGAASDLALDGELIEAPEPELDWNEALAEMREAGVHTSGDEVSASEIEAIWMRAEGPFAAIPRRAGNVIALPTRAAVKAGSVNDAWDTEVEPGEQTSLFAA